ncbi:signal recognition particle-docking protein FtsY [Candidatus Pacearchaeota archaeon]|nr:signal recognition particle-docking protein FtsY [Candidatus Pacearchaeota archaeon]
MFGKLREKFSNWLKRSKEKDEEKKTDVKKERGKAIAEEKTKKPKKKSEEVKRKVAERVGELEEVEEKAEKKIEESFETPAKELKEELDDGKEGFFSRLRKKLSSSVLTQEQFGEIFEELEIVLLENNVALEVVDKIKESLSRDLVGVSVKKRETEKLILDSLRKSILEILFEPKDFVREIEKSLEPYVVLFFGINGAGKTTSIAKFAHYLKKKGISCVLAAGDTFRAASIEQIETHAKKLGVPIIKHQYNSDPAAVGYDAIEYAKRHKIKVVLIDTAGRMYTKKDLMREMEKIVRVVKPKLKVFVGESISGNDVVEQAKLFNESVGIDGIILSKADVDEKAGAILSVGQVSGKPILFLGVGQEYEDLKEFKKKDVLKGLGLS